MDRLKKKDNRHFAAAAIMYIQTIALYHIALSSESVQNFSVFINTEMPEISVDTLLPTFLLIVVMLIYRDRPTACIPNSQRAISKQFCKKLFYLFI